MVSHREKEHLRAVCAHSGFKTGPLITIDITVCHTIICRHLQNLSDFLFYLYLAYLIFAFLVNSFLFVSTLKIQGTEGTQSLVITIFTYSMSENYLHVHHPLWASPEPAEHVASVATVSTVVTPGEPVVELSKFVLPCQVHLLIWLPCSCQKKVYP